MELEDLTSGQMSLHGKDQGETGKMKTPCRTYREENVFQALREQLWRSMGEGKLFLASVKYSLRIWGLLLCPPRPITSSVARGWRTTWDPRKEGLYWLSLDLLKQLSLSGEMWSSPSAVMLKCSCHAVNGFQFLILLSNSLSARRADERCFGYQEGKAFWAVNLGISLQTLKPVNLIPTVCSNVQGTIMLLKVIEISLFWNDFIYEGDEHE